jgi:hypothetical protein
MSGVAYLIKWHRNTSQAERLARTLVDESPTAEVAIHHDPGGSRLPEVGSWAQDRAASSTLSTASAVGTAAASSCRASPTGTGRHVARD